MKKSVKVLALTLSALLTAGTFCGCGEKKQEAVLVILSDGKK